MIEKPRTRAGGPCHCTSLRKASRRVTQLYDMALGPTGLKITQRAILAQIERCEAASMGTLAEALVMDAGGLAHTLKPLIRDRLISVGVDPKDRRNRLIRLTAAGKAKLKKSDALWQRAHESFEKGLGKDRAEVLREAVDLLTSDHFIESFTATMARS
jgi:DNA-binding MarR family transcriptional regulator